MNSDMKGIQNIPPKWVFVLQTIWKKLNSKEIGIVDAIMICLTIVSLMILHWTEEATLGMLLWRWVFMLPILLLTAMLSQNYDQYNEKFTYAWIIITMNITLAEKERLLKRHLNSITTVWSKYHRQFQKIVEGKEDVSTKGVMFSTLFNDILDGKISATQGIYITA